MGGFVWSGCCTFVPPEGVLILATNALPAGLYYINASALARIDEGNSVFCNIASFGSGSGNVRGWSSNWATKQGTSDAYLFVALSISEHDAFALVRNSFKGGTPPSMAPGLTATLIDSSFDSKKQKHSQHVRPAHPKAPK